jgi:hypothetical protein
LIIFDGGQLDQQILAAVTFSDGDLSEARYFPTDELPDVLPERLAKLVLRAAQGIHSRFLEHGEGPQS